MCGLFASIGFVPEERRIDVVAHRGPDGRGWGVVESAAGPVALGHRRLAIFDLSEAGLQPMADASGRYTIVFNGEIYNFIELRAELTAAGDRFATQTDTEVLLAMYRRFGASMLPRLRGMFAFVIWDRKRQELFAARDPFGIKPLYMVETSKGVALASEIKQLLGLESTTPRLNTARAMDFLGSGILDHTEETLFEGITQLRGGEWLAVSTEAGRPQCTRGRFHDLNQVAASPGLSFDEAADEFAARLSESVRLHLRSDIRVGSCLSGGLDSSSIVGLASEPGSIETISAVYDGEAVDESRYIDAVVARTGAISHKVSPSSDDVAEKFDRITWHQDEPFGSTSIVAQYAVFAEARRAGLTVMLDGQGADEPLGGYADAWPHHHARLMRNGRIGELHASLRARSGQGASPLRAAAGAMSLLLPDWLPLPRRGAKTFSWLNPGAAGHGGRRALDQMAADRLGLMKPNDLSAHCRLLTYATNLPMLLHWEDRNSMAHSIEARVPFLDMPLAQFALGLPHEHRIGAGEQKRVLRRAMRDLVPQSVLDRRDKIGFATPEAGWLRGPLRELVHQGVEDCIERFPGLFIPARLRLARDAALAGQRPFGFEFWRVASLGRWGRVFNVAG
ncbi:asparagine synthase (glutamine-hydrolyzing) [Aliihoeflea aestuarii]|uniref:asparagine synthase (glutamine-hydrolyzing) n=1 Tax=Aliihoeflea aestuarii TaxID=453840 RepID=UPI002093F877|nr:asparagine synthase (glutamine-hydrolyzing) [Aliihoeflea aestuarii]MCO6390166.1 asparagine synthase (glutamine-hydrolyzing) [Aliihoeflea aestuarii]